MAAVRLFGLTVFLAIHFLVWRTEKLSCRKKVVGSGSLSAGYVAGVTAVKASVKTVSRLNCALACRRHSWSVRKQAKKMCTGRVEKVLLIPGNKFTRFAHCLIRFWPVLRPGFVFTFSILLNYSIFVENSAQLKWIARN